MRQGGLSQNLSRSARSFGGKDFNPNPGEKHFDKAKQLAVIINNQYARIIPCRHS
jgi:hypothetical protein